MFADFFTFGRGEVVAFDFIEGEVDMRSGVEEFLSDGIVFQERIVEHFSNSALGFGSFLFEGGGEAGVAEAAEEGFHGTTHIFKRVGIDGPDADEVKTLLKVFVQGFGVALVGIVKLAVSGVCTGMCKGLAAPTLIDGIAYGRFERWMRRSRTAGKRNE